MFLAAVRTRDGITIYRQRVLRNTSITAKEFESDIVWSLLAMGMLGEREVVILVNDYGVINGNRILKRAERFRRRRVRRAVRMRRADMFGPGATRQTLIYEFFPINWACGPRHYPVLD
jgi:hypothetical protein